MSKWVLILGANSDIAIATARRFAKAGCNLYLASRNMDELEKTATDIQLRNQIEVKAVALDATDFASHVAFYKSLEPKPAGVIVAFGVMHDQKAAQDDFVLAQQMVNTNYLGALSLLENCCADFAARKSGFIVGISSVAGDRGRKSNYIYGSSKAAFTAYLAGLRHRLINQGVSVLTVKPGFVATKMTAGLDLPAKLTAQTDEVAEAIFRGVKKEKQVIYIKPIWRSIMLIIQHLPNFVFHRTQL